jgi:TPR repeat protein
MEEECRQRESELGRDGLVRYWTEPAHAGDAEAQFCIGLALRPPNAWIGPANEEQWAQDAREAVKWIRRSAEQGLAAAQEALGHAYARGSITHDGVSQDLGKAKDWMEKAAKQGSPWPNVYLGQWYRDGNAAVSIDNQRAYQHLLLAVELLRAQTEPTEFVNMMGFFGLEQAVEDLALELPADVRANAESWVQSELEKFTRQ